MLQVSRNLIDVESGALRDKRFLMVNRDAKYSATFRQTLEREAIGVYDCHHGHRSLNAYAERFARSAKEECLSKLIPIGPGMLERSLRENINHYHRERNYQGVGNRLITPMTTRHHVAQTSY